MIELRGITKTFPGVVANAGVDLAIHPGEVLALLGENGAGKSTLMQVLAGLYRPDDGEIRVRGARVELRAPRDAIALGIGMVHQHFRLVEAFTVAENVLLGWHEPRFVLHPGAGAGRVERLSREYGLAVDPHATIWQLSVGERQRVEILKMLYRSVQVLILDEPTAVLTPQEVEPLFAAIGRMRAEGRSVVFISHKLDEVMAIADRIVVMRGGRVVGETRPAETSPRALARMMVGQEIASRPKPATEPGPVVLRVEEATARSDRGHEALLRATLEVRRGEIVGVAGVAGNGQRELAEAIAGLRPLAAGRIVLDGREITALSPRRRWERGIAYIPEDRLGEGLVGAFGLPANSVLRGYDRPPVSTGPWMRPAAAASRAAALAQRFQVRAASLEAPVRHLSGGNQQRLLVGREVWQQPQVLVAMHPTRGLDVDATAAVHQVLLDLRASGLGIVLISESLDELLALADRVAVLYRGRIVGERPAHDATREALGLLMAGAVA